MQRTVEVLDCGNFRYNYSLSEKKGSTCIDLNWNASYNGSPVIIRKRFTFSQGMRGVKADYEISGASGIFLGIELNINLLAAHEDDRFYKIPGVAEEDSYLDCIGASSDVRSFSMIDRVNDMEINVVTTPAAGILRYPIYTVSQSDSGFEKNYQGSSIVMIYRLEKDMRISVDLLVK